MKLRVTPKAEFLEALPVVELDATETVASLLGGSAARAEAVLGEVARRCRARDEWAERVQAAAAAAAAKIVAHNEVARVRRPGADEPFGTPQR